jgi:peptide/nickel transport system substrate-binding protein
MKKLRFIALFALLSLVVSTAFAQDATTVTTAFRESQPNTLDPAAATSTDEFFVLRNVCDGLVTYDPTTLAPAPALATSWDISDDGTVYTFHLRDGVTFTDGSTFDANDVKYTLDRLAQPATGTSYTAGLVLGSVVGWSDVRPAVTAVGDGTPTPTTPPPVTSISGVKVVDPMTVEITLTKALPSFLESLTLPGGYIVPEGDTDFTNGPVCAGAYSIKEYTPQQQITLVANDSYWGGAPAVKTAIIKVIPQQSEAELEYEAGNLDLVSVAPADMSRLEADATFSKQLVKVPLLSTFLLRINLHDDVMKDPAVRRALAAAIDRQTIVDTVLQGQGVPAEGLFPPGLSVYDASFQPFVYDPAAIKKSLADAGYPDGVTITVTTAQVETENAVLNAITQTAAPAGITFKVNSVEASVATQNRNDCTIQAASVSWGFDYPDAENIATQVLAGSVKSRINCGYKDYENVDQVQALYDQAKVTPLGADRDKLWQQFQELAVGQEAAVIPIYHPSNNSLVNPRLGGMPIDNQGNTQFKLITLGA